MKKSIFRYIWQHSAAQQIYLLIVIVSSYPLVYIGFQLPKFIINDAIGGGTDLRTVGGLSFSQIEYLFFLCAIFLLVVFANGGIKYAVNVYRGLLGERLLRRLRYELIERILRFPIPAVRKVSQGEVVAMITSEVEPLGGFMGDSISLPAFQGGILLTAFTFLMVENYIMGLAAMSLYPVQIYLIPKLQRRVNELGKTRVRLVRTLSGRIGETMSAAQEIHAHDTTQYELAEYTDKLGGIFNVRMEIYRKKFFIKFFNNFLAQLGPFFFFSIGGYLTIQGALTIGGLVAMLSAYKEMYSPWKELLQYYQLKEDARIKFEQVVAQFEPVGLLEEKHIGSDQELDRPLTGELVASGISYTDDSGNTVIESLSTKLDLTKHTAIVGPTGSGKMSLTMIMARLLNQTYGQLSIDDLDLKNLTESVTGRKIAFAGPETHIFSSTLGDNLFYSLKHRPSMNSDDGTKPPTGRETFKKEARLSGNSPYDITADWFDYRAVGVRDFDGLIHELIRILRIVNLDEDVFQFGLRSTIDPDGDREITDRILRARYSFREKTKDPSIARLVEPFDPHLYNTNATLIENLMFGTPVGDVFKSESIAHHPYVRHILQKTDLESELVNIGYRLASLMVEMFSDLNPDNQYYQQFNFFDPEDLPVFQNLISHVGDGNVGTLSSEEQYLLIEPAFRLIPARHRLGLVDDRLQGKILSARGEFRDNLPADLHGAIDFFDPEKYNAAETVQDNILFGKVVLGEANATRRIGQLLRDEIDAHNLYDAIIRAGLSTRVGTGGSLLPTPMQQKIALVRCLLKRPDVLVLYQVTANLDNPERVKIIKALLEEFKGRGVIFAIKFPSLAKYFDHILVMRHGELVEQGPFEKLSKPGTYFSELMNAERS